jgi:phosphoglycolate phosphatase/pyrophosphatase PpaX
LSAGLARRCLIVDHDDTSVSSTPSIHYPAHVESLRSLRPGREPIGLEGWLLKNYHPGFRRYLEDEVGLSPGEVAEATRIWREFSRSRHADFFPGMLETLVEFHSRGGAVVVVSHSDPSMVERDYRAAAAERGGEPFLPDLVFGWDEEESRRKPHPWPALEALRRLGLGPGDALVLDDLKPGADMAAAAGIDCAGAGWGHVVPEIRVAMRASCRWYFESVGDFAAFLLG